MCDHWSVWPVLGLQGEQRTRGCHSTAACFAFRRVPRTSCSPLPSGPAPGRRGLDTSRLRNRKNPQGRCSVRQAPQTPQTVTSCPDRRDRRLSSRGLSCFEVDALARGESGFWQTRPSADDREARGRRATSMVDTIARISSQSVSGSRMRDHSPQRSAATRPWRLRGVPTPNRVRIRSSRFNAAVCTSTRLRNVRVTPQVHAPHPTGLIEMGNGRSKRWPRCRSSRFPRAPQNIYNPSAHGTYPLQHDQRFIIHGLDARAETAER